MVCPYFSCGPLGLLVSICVSCGVPDSPAVFRPTVKIVTAWVLLNNDSVTGIENFCDLHATADDVTSTDKVEFFSGDAIQSCYYSDK